MDAALVGKQSRRTEHRGSCERQHDWARSKKNELKPHLAQQWVIPPQASSAFVAATEDILAVYKRPRDGDCPLVCLDETSKQLLADTRMPYLLAMGASIGSSSGAKSEIASPTISDDLWRQLRALVLAVGVDERDNLAGGSGVAKNRR
jgi:hypothetical protein